MPATPPLRLATEVLMIPADRLTPEVRQRAGCSEGDVVLTRLHSRTMSVTVDGATAELLAEFREPASIVDVVIRRSRAMGADPGELLEGVFPVLERLIAEEILIDPSAAAGGDVRLVRAGTRVGEYEVCGAIQILRDSEVHQVKGPGGVVGALKIVRDSAGADLVQCEARALARLEGAVTPQLLGTGELDGRPYLVSRWCFGVPCSVAADELRALPAPAARAGLLDLIRRIVRAYCVLHDRGVAHGDVHPRNVLIDQDGAVRVIDFGLSRVVDEAGEETPPGRGGVGFYYDPQLAESRLTGRPSEPTTQAADQYSLGALLYLLLTGAHYIDLPLEERGAMKAIVEEPMLPFAARNLPPWLDVEAVLATALAKQPEQRYPSLAALAAKLDEVHLDDAPSTPAARPLPPAGDEAAASRLLASVLERLDGVLLRSGLEVAPTCSINYGAGGVALALWRIACARDDPRLLALADRWLQHALRRRSEADAFYNADFQVTPQTVGRASLFHGPGGLFALQALLGRAMGIVPLQQRAIHSFIAASEVPCDQLDLTLGRSGALLAAALLLDGLEPSDRSARPALLKFGDQLLATLAARVDSLGPIRACREIDYLGAAHGWTGVLFAILQWCRATGQPVPAPTHERLAELAGHAEPHGRGVRFPVRTHAADPERKQGFMSGWCNGSAGISPLFTLAHQLVGEPRYLDLAERAGWHAWEHVAVGRSLCCGLAGRAYALLNLARHTGDRRWTDRARVLAYRAAAAPGEVHPFRDSLFKGEVGVALVVAEMSRPAQAAMPLFDAEAW